MFSTSSSRLQSLRGRACGRAYNLPPAARRAMNRADVKAGFNSSRDSVFEDMALRMRAHSLTRSAVAEPTFEYYRDRWKAMQARKQPSQ